MRRRQAMETTTVEVSSAATMVIALPAWNKMIAAFVFISTLGAFGNALVLVSYFKYPSLQTPSNMLIANQGLADLFTCIASTLYTAINYSQVGQMLLYKHKYVCLLVICSLFISAWSSLFNVLLLSVDRLVVIRFPFFYARVMNETLMRRIIVTLWVFMVVVLSLPLFGVNTWQSEGLCSASNVLPIAFFVNFFVLSSLIVLVTVGLVNLVICAIVIKKRKVAPGGSELDAGEKSQWRLTKLLLAVVGVFYACWLPYGVLTILFAACPCFKKGIPTSALAAMEVAKLLCIYNSALNPIIYVWKSKEFRRAFQKILNIKTSIAPESTNRVET
jgi:hypothetical protein